MWHISYYKYCFQFNTSGEGMRGGGGDLGFAMKAGGRGGWPGITTGQSSCPNWSNRPVWLATFIRVELSFKDEAASLYLTPNSICFYSSYFTIFYFIICLLKIFICLNIYQKQNNLNVRQQHLFWVYFLFPFYWNCFKYFPRSTDAIFLSPL